ncbi:MAG: bifunctional folylpolyglutamate synthase/dihydrofolate synthase [Flavobacteriaceae bacterium]|nr:bifunctional folylpolyglutamate synthase/dihydrofolate synthase [Flavobacteriaceae bacterium]
MKTYQDTLDWMFSKLPIYQKVGGSAYRSGLERILAMDAHLDQPHRTFKSIHVAGTNGKGSTSHILASVLQSAGYKVGLYTSPHLLDFRERIKVNGQLITEKKVIQFIERHAAYFESEQISFFEMTVGMAFDHFRESQVEYAIVEVGLGGRLDATNIIMPVLSVITNIGLDHTEFLGITRTQIAKEKAGIIKSGIPVVVGQKDEETEKVFEEIALQRSSKLTFAKVQDQDWETDLKGVYQVQNIQTALTALACLDDPKINLHTIKQGFRNVISNTGLLGRWQIIADSPQLIMDVGHNKEGLSFLVTELQKLEFGHLHLIMGFVKGKQVVDLISLFPSEASFYLSSPKIDRAIPLSTLKTELTGSSKNIDFFPTVIDALNRARSSANTNDLILVCGSTFVVAEVLSFIKNQKV